MRKNLGARALTYPTPVLVIGSYDQDGKANIMTAAWGGICCSNPPCIAVSLRKATHTHGNIMARKAFTVNVPSKDHMAYADYAGMYSGKDEDKFARLDLTPMKAGQVDAPFVNEFPVCLECRLLHVVEIGLHTQFIGEIIDVHADEAVLNEEGLPDMAKVDPITYSPSERAYYSTGPKVGEAFKLGKILKNEIK